MNKTWKPLVLKNLTSAQFMWFCENNNACSEGLKATEGLSLAQWWNCTDRPDWMLWLLYKMQLDFNLPPEIKKRIKDCYCTLCLFCARRNLAKRHADLLRGLVTFAAPKKRVRRTK